MRAHTQSPQNNKTFFTLMTSIFTKHNRRRKITMQHPLDNETIFKAKIVHLILSKKTEEALELLSKYYKVSTPKLKVGMPKRDAKYPACYVAKTATIHVADSSKLDNPFVILHEFYHHLRTTGMTHKGTEKNADNFAKEYITQFRLYTAKLF